jgi:hypothetical protein
MNPDALSAEPSLDSIAAQVAGRPGPRVLVLDSLEPLTVCAEAAPLVVACGAVGWTGGSSLDDEAVCSWDPELVVLLAADDEMDDAEDDLRDRAEWLGTAAARGGDCYCAVRPTFLTLPRVLATILHPDLFTAMLPAHSVRIAIPRERSPEPQDAAEDGSDSGELSDSVSNN